MGSGKGKSRRVRATQLAGAKTMTDSSVWASFVKSQGLGNVRLSEYYGAHRPPPNADKSATRTYQKELVSELFRDLVEIGVVQLPQGSKADDFVFDVVSEPHKTAYSSYGVDRLYVNYAKSMYTTFP